MVTVEWMGTAFLLVMYLIIENSSVPSLPLNTLSRASPVPLCTFVSLVLRFRANLKLLAANKELHGDI